MHCTQIYVGLVQTHMIVGVHVFYSYLSILGQSSCSDVPNKNNLLLIPITMMKWDHFHPPLPMDQDWSNGWLCEHSEMDVSQKCPHPLMTRINWLECSKLKEEETLKVVG